jgi:hypothetical protein
VPPPVRQIADMIPEHDHQIDKLLPGCLKDWDRARRDGGPVKLSKPLVQ